MTPAPAKVKRLNPKLLAFLRHNEVARAMATHMMYLKAQHGGFRVEVKPPKRGKRKDTTDAK